MNRLTEVFSKARVVLPVIHAEDEVQALRNAAIARDAGADGVFLINHGPSHQVLLQIHERVCEEFPGWWIGVNCLDLLPEMVVQRVNEKVAGIWVDNAGVEEGRAEQHYAAKVDEARRASGWPGLYFGGVAFKYQRAVEDLASAARIATRHMDVVTTSGAGTGSVPSRDKIRRMKEAMGDFPLAIASGITPENVGGLSRRGRLLPRGDRISSSFTELDPTRVRMLVDIVHEREQPCV